MAEEYSLASTEADTFLPEALQFRPSTPLVDIGANLTHESFQRDLGDVLARAKAANVTTLIVTGTDVAHAKQALQMAQQYAGSTQRRAFIPMMPVGGMTRSPKKCGSFTVCRRLWRLASAG